MERTKLKGYAALLLVFTLGILLGGAGMRAMLQRRYESFARDPAMFERRRLGALSHRLKLDDAQRDRVRDVLGKYGKQRRALTREIMARCGAPLHEQKSRMDGELRALLRPDQQARYDQLIRDSEAHGPPDGPPEPRP
jgi:hypothetical protein